MDYNTVYDQLGSTYQPQTDLVNSQIAQLQPEQDAQQASLDQAKVNAFKDITNSANSKGVLFSGVPIDQQSTYVGTKYLPAVADLKSTFQNNKNTLLGQLNDINAKRSQQASDTVASAAKQASDDAYKQAQLQLSYARLGNSQSNAASSQADKLAAQYKATGKSSTDAYGNKNTSTSNGYNFTGPNGTPVSLAQYVAGSGGGVDTVLNLLQNGSKYDQSIYKQVYNLKDPNAILSKIQQLDKSKAYGF